MAEHKRRGCFLFYVYGYCLGFGTGVIAAIVAWTESSPMISRALLTSALGLSIVTLISQAIISYDKCGSSMLMVKSAVNIVGLSFTAIATCAGTFCDTKAEGLFFLCGVFSTALYIMTCVAFTVNLLRERARKNNQPTQITQHVISRESNSSTCLEVVARWMPADPYLGDPFASVVYESTDQQRRSSQHQLAPRATISTIYLNPTYDRTPSSLPEGFHELTITQLALLGIPAGISLPSYSDVLDANSDSPPQYTETSTSSHDLSQRNTDNVTSAHNVTSLEVADSDLPPRYDDVFSHNESGAVTNRGVDTASLNEMGNVHINTQNMTTGL